MKHNVPILILLIAVFPSCTKARTCLAKSSGTFSSNSSNEHSHDYHLQEANSATYFYQELRMMDVKSPNIHISFDENGDYFIDYQPTGVLFPNEDRPIGEEIQWEYVISDSVRMASMKAEEEGRELVLSWTFYADDMEPKHGTYPIKKLQTIR